MTLSWIATNLIAALLLPPLNGLLLIGTGTWLWHRRPRLGKTLVGTGFLLLWLLALPVVGKAMLRSLEDEPLARADALGAQAIVVLGGGRYRDAPEYGNDTVGEYTLVRLRYAAKLHRETGLPLLVTGGAPDGGDLSEGVTMSRVLTQEFMVPVRWTESASINTSENAKFSAALLKAAGIKKVLLVTHAWHMPRSSKSFTDAGLIVLPAATSFHRDSLSLFDFISQSYKESRNAMHEWIGLLWYRLKT